MSLWNINPHTRSLLFFTCYKVFQFIHTWSISLILSVHFFVFHSYLCSCSFLLIIYACSSSSLLWNDMSLLICCILSTITHLLINFMHYNKITNKWKNFPVNETWQYLLWSQTETETNWKLKHWVNNFFVAIYSLHFHCVSVTSLFYYSSTVGFSIFSAPIVLMYVF